MNAERGMATYGSTDSRRSLAGSRAVMWSADTRDRNGAKQLSRGGAIFGPKRENQGGSSTESGGQDDAHQ